VRLAKYLAHSGVASRRAAEAMIAAGRVRVGGAVVRAPARDVDPDSGVEVDRRPVSPEPREVWMLNKPADVTSTAHEPGRRRAVTDLIASERRLYPVGRLDADSTGLILVTNDGELANRLTHPRYEVPRTYRARVRRPPTDAELRRLRQGVELEDGPTAPARVRRVSPRVIEITIREGRNRQVRRMAEAIGNEVVELIRIAFGPLRLGELAEGEARKLKKSELRRLWKDPRP
jgi:23S rRNA pseudouridine2605 synthase